MNPSDLPYKEEVAGSNPASPTEKKQLLQVKRSTSEIAGHTSWPAYCYRTATYSSARVPEGDRQGLECP